MIVVFGSISVDLVFLVAALPQPNQTLQLPGMDPAPGGKGANQAVAASRDGAHVVLAGAVGRDEAAQMALRGPEEAGVETGWVARTAGRTGCTSLLRDPKGQVQTVEALGANLLARADQIDDAALGPGTTLLLQLDLPLSETQALIRRARRRGARIVLNFSPAHGVDPKALREIDVLVIGEGISGWLSERLGSGVSAASLRAALGLTVVRSLGVSGLEYASDGAIGRLPPRPIHVVDETGAQDCLSGVLAAALDRGLALEDAIRRANVAASICCERLGAQSAMPFAAEIDAAMAG
jgi:ribokinase